MKRLNHVAEIDPGQPGLTRKSRFYDSVFIEILKQRNQTYAEAAKDLSISPLTFWKLITHRVIPDFSTEFWRIRIPFFEKWSTLSIDELYPPKYFKHYHAGPTPMKEETWSYKRIMWHHDRYVKGLEPRPQFLLPAPRRKRNGE